MGLARGSRRRLAAWRAEPCLDRCWMIAANTTSRIVYDTLAREIDDQDRLLVSELDRMRLWHDLRGDVNDFAHRRVLQIRFPRL